MAALPSVQTAVIGAGVVGLAIARELARRGQEVIVIESGSIIGSGTSSRNSEVIHAGIYYPKDSVKARACVQGRHLLYSFVERHSIPHKKCGKLIVANSAEELDSLDGILEKGRQNGVDDLRIISPEEVREREPECRCMGAILSPSTGIVDSHAFMQALQGGAEDHGAAVAFNCAVESGEILPSGYTELLVRQRDTEAGGTGSSALDVIVCRNVVSHLHTTVTWSPCLSVSKHVLTPPS